LDDLRLRLSCHAPAGRFHIERGAIDFGEFTSHLRMRSASRFPLKDLDRQWLRQRFAPLIALLFYVGMERWSPFRLRQSPPNTPSNQRRHPT